MASSSGTTNPLIAGVGAFAVVVGGLTMYKRYGAKKSTPSSAGHAEVGITAPDLEALAPTQDATAPRTISPENLISVELSRAFRMIGRSSEELLTEYGEEIFVTGDASIKWQRFDELNDSSFLVPFALTISGDFNAELGFYCDRDGKVTRIVVMTGGAMITTDGSDVAATVIKQADLNWQPGLLERSVEHGLALRYTTETMRIVATHRLAENQWRFDVSPIKNSGDIGGLGTIGTGKYATANCDVVGRSPTHLGNGKFFTIGQSQQAALAAAQRVDPEMSFDDSASQGLLTLAAGVPDMTLSVATRFGKVQSLSYFDHNNEDRISEQRHDEFSACWNKRVAFVEGVAYWQAGAERYRLSEGELHIARVEQVQRVVQRLADGIGKADTNLADLEAETFIANTPDWPAATDLYLDDDAINVLESETVIGFDGNPTRRVQLLQEIERGLGAGTLMRNDAGIPVLQFKTKRAIITVQPVTAAEMSIMVNGRDLGAR